MPKSRDDDTSETPARRRKSSEVDQAPRASGSAPAAPQDPALNIIQLASAGETRAPAERSSETRKDQKKVKDAQAAGAKRPAETAASRAPDSVYERFIQIGDRFYFPDGQDAFTRERDRLTTRSENAIVIQSMVAIARAESQTGVVTVGGTDFFRKEVWFAGSLAGLEVKGYEPSQFERERLVRAIAARRDPTVEEGKDRESGPSNETGAAPRPAEGDLIVGRLVDHGPAPYQHNPKEQSSYFVRIETERGDRDIWGVDLERAFKNSLSTPGIGDEVGLRALGQEAVRVSAPKRDAEGNEVAREELATHRNQWSVERKTFLDERQKMAAVFRDRAVQESEAIRRHPELEGSYLQLQSGQALASEQYKSALHREQFVDHLREYLAKNIQYGWPLEPVRLRPREEQTAEPRVPDPDYNPTR